MNWEQLCVKYNNTVNQSDFGFRGNFDHLWIFLFDCYFSNSNRDELESYTLFFLKTHLFKKLIKIIMQAKFVTKRYSLKLIFILILVFFMYFSQNKFQDK